MADETDAGKSPLGSKAIIIIILIAAVGGVVWIKSKKSPPANEPPMGNLTKTGSSLPLPKLVDLGAGKCIPCKMMAPILEDLKKEYKGKFDVVFIDVWENPGAGKKYGIKIIPTQIFYDAAGKELFRHEGLFSKEDILKKWKELGIELDAAEEKPREIGALVREEPSVKQVKNECKIGECTP